VSQLRTRLESVAARRIAAAIARAAVLVMAALWATTFSYLAVVRHLAGGSHAEDLGFTDQVLANFLRGQFFRMSLYQGAATWNTELDLSHIARPDSLLAFHAEPMLLLLAPIYALGGGISVLLILQATALAAGAIPAYRLGRQATNSVTAGIAVAMAYLLSPLGQWAVLADFHTSTLAAPLLLLSVERLVVARKPAQALLAAVLAATAREDVAPVLAVLGLTLAIRRPYRRTGAILAALGLATGILATLVIRSYSGGMIPFDVRYGPTLSGGLATIMPALERPGVLGYASTLLLSGGWLGLFAPVALLPALPALALNALSTSPWMAAGKAHYSGLVLPFIVAGAAAGLGRFSHRPHMRTIASTTLVLTSLLAYSLEGAGPLAANFAPAALTDHSARAAALADGLPQAAAISASSSLVPRLSRRPRVYIFPAIVDADYVFLDVRASPAPTSAGDVFLRVRDMLADGGWQLQANEDGLLVLQRHSGESTTASDPPGSFRSVGDTPTLLSASLVPSPDGAIDVDGPRWILRTAWQTTQRLAGGTRLEFQVDLRDGQRLPVWDVADLWWNPPDRWQPGQPVTIDVPDIPVRQFKSWQATWSTP
jgi:uncharacterized membrane protein